MSFVLRFSRLFLLLGGLFNLTLLSTGFTFHQPIDPLESKPKITKLNSLSAKHSAYQVLSPYEKCRRWKRIKQRGGKWSYILWASVKDDIEEKMYVQRKLRPGIPNLSKEREPLPIDFYRENAFDKFALALFRQLVQQNTRAKDGKIYISPFEGKFH